VPEAYIGVYVVDEPHIVQLNERAIPQPITDIKGKAANPVSESSCTAFLSLLLSEWYFDISFCLIFFITLRLRLSL
jgi:hypothetical protein